MGASFYCATVLVVRLIHNYDTLPPQGDFYWCAPAAVPLAPPPAARFREQKLHAHPALIFGASALPSLSITTPSASSNRGGLTCTRSP